MDYVKYLVAKETVDDRALNISVLQSFEARVQQHVLQANTSMLRFVEVGCGIGTMFLRLFKRGIIFASSTCIEYAMVDIKQDVLLAAKDRIITELREKTDCLPKISEGRVSEGNESVRDRQQLIGHEVVHNDGVAGNTLVELCSIECSDKLTVRLYLGDAMHFLEQRKKLFDVVIGAAVLDIWPMETALTTILQSLDTEAGLSTLYFPINFDGTTDFFPQSNQGVDFDGKVENAFHQSMGMRTVGGQEGLACHTGRRLIPCLQHLGVVIDACGASSWIVSPDGNGQYKANEGFFLQCIFDLIAAAAKYFDDPQLRPSSPKMLEYLSSRRKHISEGTLYYVAHNIDVSGHI